MGAPTLQIVTPIKAFSARSRFPFPRSLHPRDPHRPLCGDSLSRWRLNQIS